LDIFSYILNTDTNTIVGCHKWHSSTSCIKTEEYRACMRVRSFTFPKLLVNIHSSLQS